MSKSNLQKLNKEIHNLNSQIGILEVSRETLTLERQKVCPHIRIEQSGGEEWWDYYETPNHGHTPLILLCLDCGLVGNSTRYNNDSYEDYMLLDNLVQERRVRIR